MLLCVVEKARLAEEVHIVFGVEDAEVCDDPYFLWNFIPQSGTGHHE